jgi:DNA topoisomerase-1
VRNSVLDDVETVRFRFRAKGGIAQDIRVTDAALATFVERSHERSPASRLYAWLEGRRMRAAVASDVNEDIRARTGGDFTAKDFRTLRGTIAAADRLAEIGVERTARARARAAREAFEYASSVLGNTPAIAKASYVDPRVVTAYEHGRTIERRGLRETALLALLVDDA